MRILVLMSTYNGEKYITHQLKSILNQLPYQGRIIIRDDGSKDNTRNKIRAIKDTRIELIEGNNIGFALSYLELLALTPLNYDIYMLSDQDDIWLPDKIQRSVSALSPYLEIPALYCTRMELVDENLNYLGLSPLWPNLPSFSNALTENIVTGCTAAITRPLRTLAIIPDGREKIFFHDWWLYLVGSAFGKVIYDPIPTIQYRQHQNNVIGMKYGINRYLAIIKFISTTSWIKILENQNGIFKAKFSDNLPNKNLIHLNQIINDNGIIRRTRIALSLNRHRQFLLDEIMLRILLLFDHRKSPKKEIIIMQ